MRFGRFQRALHQGIDFDASNVRITLDGMDGKNFKGMVLDNGKPVGRFSASPETLKALASMSGSPTLEQVRKALGIDRRIQQLPLEGAERRSRMEA